MTYYDWVESLEQLKTGPRNDSLLDTLYNNNIELVGNILYRFIIHINDVIRTRLKNALDGILLKMSTIYNDLNSLSLEVINIKKEIAFAKKIINLPSIPEENKKKFKETLQRFADEINEALEKSLTGFDTTGEAIIMIKNSKINILED
ncbi:MAG: hypothetical protein IJO43_03615 [Bacilli bacterium]|nr:hypothetical protein [Bacilli bacterium]